MERQIERSGKRANVGFFISLETANTKTVKRAWNLGPGGFGIRAGHACPGPEEPMEVSFRLPGVDHLICCAGKLAWRIGDWAGLRFTSISPYQASLIDQYVEGKLGAGGV